MGATQDIEKVGANRPGQSYHHQHQQPVPHITPKLPNQWTQFQDRGVETINPHSIASHLVSLKTIRLQYMCESLHALLCMDGPEVRSVPIPYVFGDSWQNSFFRKTSSIDLPLNLGVETIYIRIPIVNMLIGRLIGVYFCVPSITTLDNYQKPQELKLKTALFDCRFRFECMSHCCI